MPPVGSWLENELAHSLSLDGVWQFSLAGEPFRDMPVPSAWEAHSKDKITDGPAVYRRAFQLPAFWPSQRRIILEFDAISFDCRVTVNSALAGAHRGMWSAFQLDITDLVRAGENLIEVETYKPGQRFRPRESLAGFLPDVATTFGGIWQSVRLWRLDAALVDLRVFQVGQPESKLIVSGSVIGAESGFPVEIEIELSGADGVAVRSELATTINREGGFEVAISLNDLRRWSPAAPALHNVTISASQGVHFLAKAIRTVGVRDVMSMNGRALIDGRPLHLRGVLDWGWQPEIIRPAPDRAQLLRQFEQARSLGFNMVKLCLYVPDEATFDVADETGMYLWLEMPLWVPRLTPEVRALALAEYEAVFRRLHHHPSIVVLSLGCELNSEADREFLQSLSALARAYFPNTLLCDNSGSAEAYGGVATAPSDFYDYHFYTDPHFFQPLVEHFDRGYRPARPWLFGEFCDADTLRDFNALQPEPWWLTEPLALDRDELLQTRDYRQRLAAAGITDGGAELTRIACRQATAVRKFILEQARRHDATGGYVISGWADTPITTSGIVDDQGELKFEPAEWQRFNADAVLLLDRERRRTWERGGDRPAYRDPFSWWQDARPELHILLSNGLGAASGGRLTWTFRDQDGSRLDHGSAQCPVMPGGEVVELAAIFPKLPWEHLPAPAECRLSVELEMNLFDGGQAIVRNEWPLWVVPRSRLQRVRAIDASLGERLDWPQLFGPPPAYVPPTFQLAGSWLAETDSQEFLQWIADGGQGVWWVQRPGRLTTKKLPFWREAIHVFEPHPLWERVPKPGSADMRFFSLATDLALDVAGLEAVLPLSRCQPVWRRFDARALTWAEYLVQVQFGSGRLWVTTLRFEGGLGRQPAGLAANPWGTWLLACLLDT